MARFSCISQLSEQGGRKNSRELGRVATTFEQERSLSAVGVAFRYVAESDDGDFSGSDYAVGVVRRFRLPIFVRYEGPGPWLPSWSFSQLVFCRLLSRADAWDEASGNEKIRYLRIGLCGSHCFRP